MSDDPNGGDAPRRHALECMIWAGTGVLWTVSGGVPRALDLLGEARTANADGLTFLQISDSPIGFAKPANPHARETLHEAVDRICALQVRPSLMLHTGDITDPSKPGEFDGAAQGIGSAEIEPRNDLCEHDCAADVEGWYSFDQAEENFSRWSMSWTWRRVAGIQWANATTGLTPRCCGAPGSMVSWMPRTVRCSPPWWRSIPRCAPNGSGWWCCANAWRTCRGQRRPRLPGAPGSPSSARGGFGWGQLAAAGLVGMVPGSGERCWQGQDFDHSAVSDLAADEPDRFVALWHTAPL